MSLSLYPPQNPGLEQARIFLLQRPSWQFNAAGGNEMGHPWRSPQPKKRQGPIPRLPKLRVIRIGFTGLTIVGLTKFSIIGGEWPQTVAEDLHGALISCTRPRRFSLQPFFFFITDLFSFSCICGESQSLSGSIRQMTEKLPCSPLMETKMISPFLSGTKKTSLFCVPR